MKRRKKKEPEMGYVLAHPPTMHVNLGKVTEHILNKFLTVENSFEN